jgi:DNA polymerase III delta prime subunit
VGRVPPRPPPAPLTRRTVEKFIEKNRLPHLLLYGPPGTGKTSTILAMARRIYGADYKKQILEVRAPRAAPAPAHRRPRS